MILIVLLFGFIIQLGIALLLQVVLSAFSINLSFWICLAIVILFNLTFGSIFSKN